MRGGGCVDRHEHSHAGPAGAASGANAKQWRRRYRHLGHNRREGPHEHNPGSQAATQAGWQNSRRQHSWAASFVRATPTSARAIALHGGRRGAAGRSAARLPGVLVRLAAADRTAGGGIPRRGARDARLYNLSSRPKGVKAYDTDQPTADIRGLIQERGAQTTLLVGHDWGGSVAWATAMAYPEAVDRLAILNAAHPRKLSQGLHHPGQLRKSWYFFFDLPELPEAAVHANRWHFFRHFLPRRPPGRYP